MSASLVGSEMCIRDRISRPSKGDFAILARLARKLALVVFRPPPCWGILACLLYTSDAADDM
eukprot:13387565-Alexandrium_andersonii.AAC.1